MKFFITLISFSLFLFVSNDVLAQPDVLDPDDPDLIFTTTNRPPAPSWGMISKWGHTARLSWNPFSRGYKSYYFKGMAFRIKFPKTYQHDVVDGKKYPSLFFFHGLGEFGTIWDNELQLLHGGEMHANRVNSGTFDGFLIYPQSSSGYLPAYFGAITDLVDSLAKYVKLDLDRVNVSGLSAGGQSTWDILQNPAYAKVFCSAMPISAAQNEDIVHFPNHITVPVWIANGGKDNNPTPEAATTVINAYRALGGNIIQAYYPSAGHGSWGNFWAEPNYFPFLNAQHKANPLVHFQRREFCPEEPVNVKLELQAGFFEYEWSKDGITIPGANTNQLIVTSFGQYRGRFKRESGSDWSVWSPTPVVISLKQPTVTPPIQIDGLRSTVLPATDGSTTAPLMAPATYASYEWRRLSDDAIVSTTNIYNAPPGTYKVKVTEQFGCSSDFSAPFTVITANGSNLPDMASNVSAIAISNNSIQLDWNDNPTPINNETAFEIYRSTTPGSNYTLIAKKDADVLEHLDQGLDANTRYYYVIRAINANGAAVISNEVSVLTKQDIVAPTAPLNLIVTGTTRSSVSLDWDAATDDVGVRKYDIYVNGVKTYTTVNLNFTVNNLTALQTYSFYVRAKDASGNTSPASNQVVAAAILTGLDYKYYHGDWTVLPDFNTLTPFATGRMTNVSLSPRVQNDFIGFLWEGYIKIPVTGTYTFETNSDDGSKLYIGTYSHTATALVNNDGIHGAQFRSGTITLTAGVYPIAITFFERNGGEGMAVYWGCPEAGIAARTLIPNSAFTDQPDPVGAAPAEPGSLLVQATAYNRINLSWTDNSTNETGFEITRATSLLGVYTPIGTTGPNVTNYIDSVGLSPATQYWYKIRAVNNVGMSRFLSNIEGRWLFNGNYNDASGNSRNLSGSGSPVFNATDKREGSHALSLNGSNQFADMSFSSSGGFPSNSFVTRTVALWIKPTAAAVSGTNRMVFDFGGSDNGLALRFNGNGLHAGVASSNVRHVASVNNIATNPNWINGGWNHIAVVDDINTLRLIVNGVELATTTTGFTSTNASTSNSRIGASSGTNAFNSSSSSTNMGGLIDDVIVLTEPINTQGALALIAQHYGTDTTLALPVMPAQPANLVATPQSPSEISLQWDDNSNNETAFEVYRAVNGSNSFRLLATVNGGSGATGSYTDNSLFANTNYAYKVRAKGLGGNSAFTSIASARTRNNAPAFLPVDNVTMRYESQQTISFTAVDIDGEVLSLSVLNLPAFASFTPGANGMATLQLNPAITDTGVYTIAVVAADGNNGSDTAVLQLVVNSNHPPVISAVNPITLNEGSQGNYTLTATDLDGNATITWSLPGGVSFATLTDNNNGTAVLNLKPGYANAGNYTLSAKVDDNAGGSNTILFSVTIVNTDPPSEKIMINIKTANGSSAPAPWNNIVGVNTNNLINANNQATTRGIEFLTTSWNTWNEGAVTNNNSGVFPDLVIRDYYYFGIFGAPNTVSFRLKGLSPQLKYNVTLFGSSRWTGTPNNGSTVYTINGVSRTLNVHQNQQNTVVFSAIAPDANGNIQVTMNKAAGTPAGYLNAVVLDQPFDDSTAPAAPVNLSATALPNGFVRLNWKDIAYNEKNYLVSRALSADGPYTLLNSGAANANDSSYTDNTVLSNTTYFYRIEATNDYGSSGLSTVLSATTLNKAPVLNPLSNVFVKTSNTAVVTIAATDDVSDVLSVTVSNLPGFAVYQSTGNGTGTITITPGNNDMGTYRNITVRVTDNFGETITRTFEIVVADNSTRSIYVNFGPSGATPQASPWNNYLAFPFANLTLSNLLDDAGVNTGFSVRPLQQWTGNFNSGMTTGNNSGIFPDNVIRNSIYSNSANPLTLEFAGLNPTRRYNIAFMSSINSGAPGSATFSSGAASVVVDGRYNSNSVGQLNGLVPNASGVLQVSITKHTTSPFVSLNALVIQEYNNNAPLIRPVNLYVESDLSSDRLKLTWSDRSDSESGYRICRALSENGAYTVIATTAANVTTFTDNTVSGNTRYYYKVAAVNGATVSDFSNVATNITATKVVLLNLEVNYPAASPWNNTSAVPIEGATFSNLKDNTGNNTGFEMVITKPFNGEFYAGFEGVGIFPPNVMKSNYWADAGQTCEVKFRNLDQSKRYRIGCFGSAMWNNYFIARYTINGRSVELNSYQNGIKVVYLDNIIPNEDGEVTLQINTVEGSPYSFTGAFTIEYFNDNIPQNPAPSAPAVNQQARFAQTAPATVEQVKEDDPVRPAVISAPKQEEKTMATENAVKVYPNPFSRKVQVELDSKSPAAVTIMMYDQTTRLVYRSKVMNVTAGKNTLTVDLPGSPSVSPGQYTLNVWIDGVMTKSVKLIKID
jgi:large repetitive protein